MGSGDDNKIENVSVDKGHLTSTDNVKFLFNLFPVTISIKSFVTFIKVTRFYR